MSYKIKHDEPMFDAAMNGLTESLQADHENPEWVTDVLSATERLCAVMDLLRHKLDGLSIQ
jgi:hypothetical protein